jgi:type I restriction enzyme S subunit
MEEFESNLPSTWIATTLGEVCSQPQYGYTTKGSDTGTLRLLRTTDITSGNICWESVPFCLENPSDESKYLLEDGDIVISRAGSVGVSYLLKNPERSVFASYLIRFKPYINRQYFKYFLDSPYYWQKIADNKLGIAVPNVNASKLKEIAIPLPPHAEQNRIVAKIEELFSELDKGIENLKTAQAQLKVYRQALLKHAFEGKLTAQWRTENQDKLETADALLKRIQQERAQRYQQQLADWEASGKQGSKPKMPKPLPILGAEKLSELPELPEGWGWVMIDALLSLEKKPMATGPFGTLLGKSDYKHSGLPVLGIENIGNGRFVRRNKIFVSELKAKELEPFSVEAGDVVISRSGTVGEICKIPDNLGKSFISTNLIRVSLNNYIINPDYFVYLFQGGGSVKQQVKNLCKGSSREFLNQTILSSIFFPLPNINEQNKIINSIDAKFSEADQLDQTITTSLKQAEALRQSILKKAFSGQLVPQDPHDEPAAVLLEFIRAKKATSLNNRKCGK